ncbi:MAG TPA: hypothetical protein DDW76_09200 [Cyanobacteria bacterium UBA11369]|nr:hypothetical protein [Cyanobacteria bacterium UBA11371]HBE35906.1 hypothetical protein [Cyanobacteria bacterium UBA11368]HBE48956.1 hypothetical protein [Cyanobacteria bacterium UBA11369]
MAEKMEIKKAELLAIAQACFPNQLFTARELFDIFKQSMANPPDNKKAVERMLNNWTDNGIVHRLGGRNRYQYTFDSEQASVDISAAARRFEQFRTQSEWKPSDRGDEPVFGHPTKKKNNSYWPYQISSPTSFQNSDYLNFFETTKNEKFSDVIARHDINHAIENKKLSRVSRNDGRTYVITEGNEPGYSSYVMPLNRPTPNEDLDRGTRSDKY